MNKKLVLEALNAYKLTCGATAVRLRGLADPKWMGWAQKGMELEEMMRQMRKGELKWVEQQVMGL